MRFRECPKTTRASLQSRNGCLWISLQGVVESGAARLIRMRTSLDLLMEKAGGVLGAVMAMKSAR